MNFFSRGVLIFFGSFDFFLEFRFFLWRSVEIFFLRREGVLGFFFVGVLLFFWWEFCFFLLGVLFFFCEFWLFFVSFGFFFFVSLAFFL